MRGAGFESDVRMYHCCELHAKKFNQVFAPLNGFLHTLFISVIVGSVYAALRLERLFAALAAYWAFISLSSYLSVANSFAAINRESALLLQTLRSVGTNSSGSNQVAPIQWKKCQRKMKSLQELRISGGSVFYYDKTLVLTIIEIILSQSVNLLVLY